MKKLHLLKTVFLLCALVVGSSAWALTKTEGFEAASTSTTYNSTVSVATNKSDCGIAWTIYYGTVSTNDKISGSNSAHMRYYQSASSNYPYLKTTTPIDNLSHVSFKARTDNTNMKFDISYSTDGNTWNTISTANEFSETGKGIAFEEDIPSGGKYIKISVNESITVPATGKNYKLIVDDVVFTYTSSITPATWSVSPASATVETGESAVLDLTTDYDGSLTFESNDEAVATVSYNSSTKKITITGVAPGSTTISVTGDATATKEAISKSITVNVNHPEYASNTTDEMGPLNYSYFGLTPTGSNTYAEADSEAEKADAYGVSITIERNGSSYSKPRFDTDYWRFYNGNTLTVEAPANSYITKIVFVEPGTGKAWAGSMTADKGDYVDFTKAWYATTTDVTSVTLTNDNTKRIAKLQVYLNRSTVPVTVTVAEYATLASPYNLNFSTTGITVYTATDNESSVALNEITSGKVPANTPVVLHKAGADGSTINVPVIASADAPAGTNDLCVSDGTTPMSNAYVLASKTEGVGFYPWGGSTLSAGKIYLQAKASYGARTFLGFGDETTGIADVRGKMSDVRGDFYDLSGRKVAQPTKGLYIVNGQKVIIK